MKRQLHHRHDPPPSRPSQRERTQRSTLTLDALRPVLSLFHPFLTDADAARLLRTSHTAALALLPGYTFTRHIFQPADLASLRRLRDLSLTYSLRVTQLALPEQMKELVFDPTSPGPSPIPPFVTALTFAPFSRGRSSQLAEPSWADFSAAASDWQNTNPWSLPDFRSWSQVRGPQWRPRCQLLPPSDFLLLLPSFFSYVDAPDWGINCSLPPGLLPEGLKALRVNDAFNMPLLPGSLPSTLTFLHLGLRYNQRLQPGVLPDQLVHLTVGSKYVHPLHPGVLPASLERLALWNSLRHPLEVGELPLHLKVLDINGFFDHQLLPGVLPLSLLFLGLYDFHQPFLPNVLPPSLVELRLGQRYNHTFAPGVLPSSLRALSLGGGYGESLQPGSLPEGLLFLRFAQRGNRQLPRLQVGSLPSTLLSLDLNDHYMEQLPSGVLPSSLRWIRLGKCWYRDGGVEVVLPPHAEVEWYGR